MSQAIAPSETPNAWPSLRWSALGTRDFAERAGSALLARSVAVLPVGATEQHGPHLPLGVDAQITDGIVGRAIAQLEALPPAERAPALFLPTQAIGFSPEHADFPGTLTLEPATIIALWSEIGASVARSGIRRLLIFNSHGGQVSVMDMVARQLRRRHGMLTYSSSWYQLPQPPHIEALFSAHEQRFGIHAGALETSVLLHLHPELVHTEQARVFASSSEERARRYPILGNGKSAKMGWMMQDYNPEGAAGDARAASAEKGRLLVDNAATQLVALLHEISALPYGD
ncbi:creatininase family protein [Corticibacter populi]|uniref:Creatininase family protein n=1 Tax=Corticibacter populi TaxID=1550736 RepID=A0A3M6QS44_9BURK|nr:creatininase family protein [Corticibacter populi]RMX05847.1 creatininase family protein [Corticibacter populi]RZS30836.1 creatinine amidohydrolase [Corticibacter populi]